MEPVSKEIEIHPCSMDKKREPNTYHTLQTPLLILLPEEESDKDCVTFLNLEGKRVLQKKSIPENLSDSSCVGSSHGWLILLDEYGDLYLLNPFSFYLIPLLPLEILSLHLSRPYGQESLVIKAVLSSNPLCSKNKYAVIVIYGYKAKIAFLMDGDTAWTELDGKHWPYCDIICHDNRLFALSEGGSVEVWDFHGSSPAKTMDVQPSFPKKVTENIQYRDKNRYSRRRYLVESSGDLLLAVRYIAEFVHDDGMPISELGLFSDAYDCPFTCNYKTMKFQVYKLNFFQQKWVEVESLDDCVLFLGGNHSMSLSVPAQYSPKCKRNSIYFTDDYRERMNGDYSYGGHDIGVFTLEDKIVEPLNHCDWQRIEPPPFWVIPNL